jgi:hypothetical protein
MQAFIYRHFTGGFFLPAFCPSRRAVFYLTLLIERLLSCFWNKCSVSGGGGAPSFPGHSF